MRKMMRIAAMVLAAGMALTACGGSGSSGTTAAQGSAAAGTTAAAAKPAASGEKVEDVYWTVASCPSSSAMYPFWVSLGEAIPSVFPQYKITVSEGQGAVAITKSVRNGDADLGNSVSATDYENYNGIGNFDGDPFKDDRMLFYYEVTGEMFCVTKDSGITKVTDLQGKKFCPGGTGTAAESISKSILSTFGVDCDLFLASQNDSADAYANREIVGTVKLGPTQDSYVMQLDAAIPIEIIDFTDEELDKIIEQMPYLIKVTIPAGTYDGVDHDVHTVGTPQGCQTTTALSQQDGYNVCKAMFDEAKATWQAAYPVGANNDLVALTLSSTVPLHAGTVQYLTEIGVEVPEKLIPEEYVPVQ